MSTYLQILYQIVFSTKDRRPCLQKLNRERLFRYTWGYLKNKRCHLYRINGVDDHIHILTHLHPSLALADLVKDIKISSGILIKNERLFPGFEGWQEGYGAFTYSIHDLERLIEYVKNQEAHHQTISFREELIQMLHEHGVKFDEKFLL